MAQENQLDILEKEIKKLQMRSRQLEREIDSKLDYFQDHYRSMAIKSFLPAVLAKAGFTGSIIEMFLENKKFRDTLNKITASLFDKISDGIGFLTKRFSKKEDQTV
jgi:hypothetical protein